MQTLRYCGGDDEGETSEVDGKESGELTGRDEVAGLVLGRRGVV